MIERTVDCTGLFEVLEHYTNYTQNVTNLGNNYRKNTETVH